MKEDNLYQKSAINRLAELQTLVPEGYASFFSFYNEILEQRVLSKKMKALVAVAIAHVTGCAYSIEQQVAYLKEIGVTKEETAEAVMVATMLKAGSAVAHGMNMLNAYDGGADEALYKSTYMSRYKELKDILPDVFQAYGQFNAKTMAPHLLTQKEKEIIAVAVAHVTGCAYCIVAHTKKAKMLAVTKEELAEAILVATAVKAATVVYASTTMLQVYD